MAARDNAVIYDQLHHFVVSGILDAAPLEAALLAEADRQLGSDDAWLIIDDTALPKKGRSSVGVAPQYAGALDKNANCQALVSLTLARAEVPVMVGLRLFLPESWINAPARLDAARVPEEQRVYRTKPEIALAEIDRLRNAGVRFGCVLADAGYGLSAPFRQGLSERSLTWAVGIPYKKKFYPSDVAMIFPISGRGRPRERHIPDVKSVTAKAMLECTRWQTVNWRKGTKGRLSARFGVARVRVADGPTQRIHDMGAQYLPGEEVSVIGKHRSTGLSLQPTYRCTDQATCRGHQGPLGLRTGAPAAQGRTWPRSLRRTVMARAAPALPHKHDRSCLPSVPMSQTSQRGKMESPGLHRNPACPNATAHAPPATTASCDGERRASGIG